MKLAVNKKIVSSNETDAMIQPVLSPIDLTALLNQVKELCEYEIRLMLDEDGIIWLMIDDSKYPVSNIEQTVLI